MGGKEGPRLAETFAGLHRGGRILVLPNAWDAGSARVFEAAGFPAVATTSAGVAASLGRPDGQKTALDDVIWVVRHITETVAIPVSVDLEAGYGDTPESVERACRAVLSAGAVGVNIEDGTGDPTRPLADLPAQVEKVAAAKAVTVSGVRLFVNARTDVFLRRVGPSEAWFDHAVERVNTYRAAGADCLFVPGVTDGETIGRLVAALDGPLNVLAGPNTPKVADLEKSGVSRVTLGSGPMRATLALIRRVAQELRERGTYENFMNDALSYDELNRLFSSKEGRDGGGPEGGAGRQEEGR